MINSNNKEEDVPTAVFKGLLKIFASLSQIVLLLLIYFIAEALTAQLFLVAGLSIIFDNNAPPAEPLTPPFDIPSFSVALLLINGDIGKLGLIADLDFTGVQ
ncbi:hypothetical protein Hanom_Chr08g00682441 [Helianthus anomalus]